MRGRNLLSSLQYVSIYMPTPSPVSYFMFANNACITDNDQVYSLLSDASIGQIANQEKLRDSKVLGG
jgi:hypothetical protein